MVRRAKSREPAFGSDSFLDVTANLVGVLIILIVLVGLRVANAPPCVAAIDAELQRRLASIKSGLSARNVERLELERRLAALRLGVTAKQTALAGLAARESEQAAAVRAVNEELRTERNELRRQEAAFAADQARLVSLAEELDRADAGRAAAALKLEHRSPVSQRVESDELHLELQADRVAFIDLVTLMDRAKGKWRSMEPDLRTRGRATAEVGPVRGFRMKFTVAREDMPFTQSLLYGSGSFRARLVEWQLDSTGDQRGEPLGAAIESGSQLETILARHSPNKYAVTIWTFSDSFVAFRQLRDHLTDLGYTVAARPLPIGVPIRGSVYGSRSFTQ